MLTPNDPTIPCPAPAAARGGADAVSLINTSQSIVGVDLDRMAPMPTVDGKGTHGGYCGPAVKPIALRMVAEIARDPECRRLAISGIGGIATWREAAEFVRSEEHTSELQSLMRISYAVFCLKKKKKHYDKQQQRKKKL